MGELNDKLKDLSTRQKELEVEQDLTLQKALSSDDPSEVVKAMNAVKIQGNTGTDDRKSAFVDPQDFYNTFGYKSKPSRMTYELLTNMSLQPIINAIIKTRKNQVASFSEPQKDRYSAGFVIRKKGESKQGEKPSKEDSARIDEVTEFLLRTGDNQSWARDDFNTFLRKVVGDSLVYDQMCFEVVRTKGGGIHEFLAVDCTSIRVADSYDDADFDDKVQDVSKDPMGHHLQKIGGYYPSYVQILGVGNEEVYAEYYPWELCFGVRNPTTRLYGNGYGRSELEDMVAIVTSMLWSDQYNRNFFKVGASPKGMIRIKGGGNNARLTEFKQQWKAMVAGVSNAWRTPVIDSESMDWIDLQKSSRDMEFGKWQEYLVKLACGLYTIDPSEIGFPSGQTSDQKPMFESNNASKIKYSRDKGLAPLLRFVESKINKYIVSQIYPDLRFEFIGLNADTEQEYMTKLKDEVTNWKTIDEVRAGQELPPLEKGGDIVLNPTYTANLQQMAMAEQQEEQEEQGEGEEGEEGTPSDIAFGGEETAEGGEGETETETETETEETEETENPFAKAFDDMIVELSNNKL